jgi:hypothetical protein
MKAYDDLMRVYALKKLTRMFEGFVLHTRQQSPDPASTEVQRAQNTQQIGTWLGRLRGSSRYQVTETLFRQMQHARRRGNAVRFNAQSLLLELLVEGNLAVDLVSYSTRDADSARQPEF